jgi:hypothetical protein
LNVDRVSDVTQIEIRTTQPLVPDPSPFKVEMAIAKLKRYKSQGTDEIQAELIEGGGILHSKTHTRINSIWNKEELSDQWESIIVPVHNKGDKIDCSD